MKRNDVRPMMDSMARKLHLLAVVIFICTLTACELFEEEEETTPISDNSADIEALVNSVPKFEEAPESPPQVIEEAEEFSTTEEIEGNKVITATWKCTYTTYGASENPDNFMMLDPFSSVLWPGNLVQGNSLARGVPNSVPIANRSPANITLAIVSGDQSGSEQQFSRTVETPSASSVIQAMNDILSGYNGGTPAKYNYFREHIYNDTHFNFSLKAGYSGPVSKLNGSLGIDWSEKKNRVVVKLHQQFFTMIVDDPQGPAGVFEPGFTTTELTPYIGPGNPLCYISSVTYGRVYILVYESKSTRTDLEAALNFAYNGQVASGNVDTKADFEKIMKETSVQVYQIGGDPQAGLDAASALSYDKIRDFMVNGANFSSTNVGLPISYTVKYLEDASLVRMNYTTEYTVPQCEPGPVSVTEEFTRSDFNFLFKKVASINKSTDGDCLQIRVHTFNKASGKEDLLWESPTNHKGDDSHGAFWDLPTNLEEEFNWQTPNFSIDNNPELQIKVTVNFCDFDAKREWNQLSFHYEYKSGTGKGGGIFNNKGWQLLENTIGSDGSFNYIDIKNQDGTTTLRISFKANFTDLGSGE